MCVAMCVATCVATSTAVSTARRRLCFPPVPAKSGAARTAEKPGKRSDPVASDVLPCGFSSLQFWEHLAELLTGYPSGFQTQHLLTPQSNITSAQDSRYSFASLALRK